MSELYYLHRASIVVPNHISDVVSVYNLPCLNDVNNHILTDFVYDIYSQFKHAFKIAFSAGLILQNIITDEYR